MQVKGKLTAAWFDWTFRLLFLSFALPARMQTLILFVTSVFVGIHCYQHRTSEAHKKIIKPLLLGTPFLFFLIYFFLTPTASLHAWWKYTERSLAIFIVPFIAYGLMNAYPQGLRKNLSWYVIPLCLQALLGAVLCWYHGFSNAVDFRIYFETIIGKHPTYMGMHLAMVLSILLIHGKAACFQKKEITMFVSLITGAVLILLASKIIWVVVALILLVYLLYQLKRKQKQALLIFGIGMLLLVVAWFIPYTQYRMQELVVMFQTNTEQSGLNTVSLRKVLLQIDYNILQTYGLWGIGPVQLQAEINKQLLFYASATGISIGSYNSHNEYLNQWLCFGIPGLLVFLSTLFLYWKKAIQHQNLLFILVLVIVCVTMLTENMLTRQHGVVFYALWLGLFYFESKWPSKNYP